jgi:hypothetical protein
MDNILVIDGNNLFHKNYHRNKKYGTTEEAIDMAISESFRDMKTYYEEYLPKITIVAFDSRKNWRKDYTKSDKAVTHKIYKSHRNEKRTKKEREAKKKLDEAITETALFLKKYSKITILLEDYFEADDMISGVCRLFGDTNFDLKVVSSDKDYLQFLRYNNVEITNPLHEGKDRNLEDWNNDVDLMLFEKFFRGDNKDNVRSSYPRLRKTKIVEAYYDDYKKSNLMNHEFTEKIYDEDSDEYIDKTYKVQDLFEENKLLLDLNEQPEELQKIIDSTVEREIARKKKTNFVKFLKFCKSRELMSLALSGQAYLPLLDQKH